MAWPHIFANQAGPIPLSQLDDNFNAVSGATGASQVGFTPAGSGAVVTDVSTYLHNLTIDSIVALKALTKGQSMRVFVTGYYAVGDGGGGEYWYDSTDTTSTDNGGTIIVATDGGRWKLVNNGEVTAEQFGAKGDGTTDDTAAVLAAITAMPSVIFRSRTYLCNDLTITSSNGSQKRLRSTSPNGAVLKCSGGTHRVFSLTDAKQFDVDGITFDGNGTTSDVVLWKSSVQGASSAGNSTWHDVIIRNGGTGVSGTSIGLHIQTASEINFINCFISNINGTGVQVENTNSLNINFFGGGIAFCYYGASNSDNVGTNSDGTFRFYGSSFSANGYTGAVYTGADFLLTTRAVGIVIDGCFVESGCNFVQTATYLGSNARGIVNVSNVYASNTAATTAFIKFPGAPISIKNCAVLGNRKLIDTTNSFTPGTWFPDVNIEGCSFENGSPFTFDAYTSCSLKGNYCSNVYNINSYISNGVFPDNPKVSIANSAAIALASGVYVGLSYDTVNFDQYAMKTSATQITVPNGFAGLWSVSATVRFDNPVNLAGTRQLFISKGGIIGVGTELGRIVADGGPNTTYGQDITGAWLVQLAAGDVLTLTAYQDSGGAGNAGANTNVLKWTMTRVVR